MSSRKSPSGPASSVIGFVALAQTVIPPGSAGNVATATGIVAQFATPAGTSQTRVNPKLLNTNDVVSGSPRGTVPLGTSQIGVAYWRISSVGTASAVVEVGFYNPSIASATAVANTWNLSIRLRRA